MVMHDPVKRIARMLTTKCTGCASAAAVADCAEALLRDVYDNDLVLDLADGGYMMGTASVNEYNIRMMLGPRTFFARLGAINETHFQYARSMLKSFAVVAPLSKMASMGGRMRARLLA